MSQTVFTYSLFGASLNPAGVFAAREYGASLIGNLLLTWFARNAVESEARRAIILGLCIYDAIGFVITLIAQLTGVLGPLGWFAAAIYLFFAIGFGYFFKTREESRSYGFNRNFALSYQPANLAAKNLYNKLGFVEMNEWEGGEIVARLSLTE